MPIFELKIKIFLKNLKNFVQTPYFFTEGVRGYFFLKKIIASKFQILSGNHYSSYICRLFFKLCSNEEKKEFLSTLNNYKTIKGGSQQTKMPGLNKFSHGKRAL
mgnify:CR=1 FL=1